MFRRTMTALLGADSRKKEVEWSHLFSVRTGCTSDCGGHRHPPPATRLSTKGIITCMQTFLGSLDPSSALQITRCHPHACHHAHHPRRRQSHTRPTKPVCAQERGKKKIPEEKKEQKSNPNRSGVRRSTDYRHVGLPVLEQNATVHTLGRHRNRAASHAHPDKGIVNTRRESSSLFMSVVQWHSKATNP